jgi:hypothetical protein
MTNLDYHRVQRAEIEGWDLAKMEAAVCAQDPEFPNRVAALLPGEEFKTPAPEGSAHFRKLYDLSELWLAATAEQRAYIRSKMDQKRARQLGTFRAEIARLAVEDNAEYLLKIALATIAIDNLNCGDSRDAILSVQHLLVCARQTRADWSKIVREVGALAGPAIAALFEDQLRNHPA